MKTLDEVIEVLARDEYYCIECPLQYSCGGAEGGCYLSEAARYLHEYQWHMTNPDGDRQQLEKARELLQEFFRNDSLSWDELRQMEGKPLWVERPEWKEWLLVSEIDERKCEIYLRDKWGNGAIVNGRNIGYWRAYRKERG